MAGMTRKLMRSIRRANAASTLQARGSAAGAVRAGMHQKAEHEYRRSRMAAADAPTPETVEDALDVPAAVEAEIPPEEEEEAADAMIGADEEILEKIAEEQTEEPVSEEETPADEEAPDPSQARMSADYSEERIPEIAPVTGGTGTDGSAELIYSPGDGSLKEIREPLPGMGEKYGVMPYMPEAGDPSANVAAYEEPEPEPEPVDPGE